MGHVAQTRAALAKALDLTDPERSWHTDRTYVLKITDWLTRLTIALGKIGQDLVLLSQSEIAEVTIASTGSSSTMPQKQNPVGPSAMIALMNIAASAQSTLQANAAHAHQRDGAAWFTEWMMVPQIALGASAALTHAQKLAETLTPNAAQMLSNLNLAQGTIQAEALSFVLAKHMTRPEAQAQTKALCKEAADSGQPLEMVARKAFPDIDPATFDPAQQMGDAPDQASTFAERVAKLT